MQKKHAQDYLFQQIKERLPAGQSLVETLSETLHLSQDSTYRRIRGETLLVLDEARELCEKFSLSLDQLFGLNPESVVFQNTEINAEGKNNFTTYLKGILHQIKKLAAAKDRHIIYLTKDVPLFRIFAFQPLFAFRYYFWMRTTFEDPVLLQQKFSVLMLTDETEAIGKEILSVYNSIPSTEIWNTESIHSTLQQIEYCLHAGLLTQAQATNVLESLQQLLQTLHLQAEHGCKFLTGENPASRKKNFDLFYNRLGLNTELIFTTHDGQRTIYLNNDALDYMTCTDEVYAGKVYRKLQTIMRRSTLISHVSEKQRHLFFNSLYAKLTLPVANKENQLL